jgi:phosphotransferase system HPr (HPr) family protein
VSASSEPTAEARAVLPAEIALHARPAGLVVREAARFTAATRLAANGKSANAKSILEVLALGAVGGTELVVSASGEDAVAAVTSLSELVPRLG